MILQELRSYIEQHGSVTRLQLAKQFKMSEDGVDAMLSVWLKKGVISRTVDTNLDGYVMRVRYRVHQPDSLSLNVIM
ncbi:FeoC-like transcriptional regulator [Vibrio sp. WJH972]